MGGRRYFDQRCSLGNRLSRRIYLFHHCAFLCPLFSAEDSRIMVYLSGGGDNPRDHGHRCDTEEGFGVKMILRDFADGFKAFGHSISSLVNTILLLIVYLLGVGPTSLLAKMTKKRFLQMKLLKGKDTYWEDLNLSKKPIDEYYRQF